MKIKQYDDVILKDGQSAVIVEVFDKNQFEADIGSGPSDWYTIYIELKDIEKVVHSLSNN
ncbi:hypothetical protein [Lactiplantibacillus paraxiangfangensis]|uniref:hypothetical protein n=1 Tax=Lactiplantibacillus paraxiangfangensis TaxID=3076224 RepID=UPI0030C6B7F4